MSGAVLPDCSGFFYIRKYNCKRRIQFLFNSKEFFNRSVSSGTEKSTKYSARIWCDHFCNGCGNTAFDLYDNDDRLCVVTSGFSVEKWHFFFLFLHDII